MTRGKTCGRPMKKQKTQAPLYLHMLLGRTSVTGLNTERKATAFSGDVRHLQRVRLTHGWAMSGVIKAFLWMAKKRKIDSNYMPSGKGKTMETIKRLIVSRSLGGKSRCIHKVQKFLWALKYFVWHYNNGYMSYFCPNPKSMQHYSLKVNCDLP